MAEDGYFPIQTISGAASSYTFSNIPNTFTALTLRGEADTSTASLVSYTIDLRINNDSSSTYNASVLRSEDGGNLEAYVYTQTGLASWLTIPGGTFNTGAFFETDIYGYSDSLRYTFLRTQVGWSGKNQASKGVTAAWGAQWRNTADVTTLTTVNYSAPFGSDTHITLYGRK